MEKKDKTNEQAVEKKKRGRPKKVVQEDNMQKTGGKKSKKKTDDAKPVEVAEAEKVVSGVGGNGNLIPFSLRTEKEQRAIRTAGGVASGVARRRKKELREFTKDFLMQEAAPIIKGNMGILGVEADQMTNMAAMVTRLFNKAVNQGDLNSARTLIEWAGMAPLQQERENAAVAQLSQAIASASNNSFDDGDTYGDVVFYIPHNNRDDLVEVETVTRDVD